MRIKNAYIYLLSILFGLLFFQNIEAQNWTEIAKVCATERWKGANLGYSVDIYGDYAIVGAPYDFIINNKGAHVDSVGAAYIYKYDGTNWQAQQKLYLETGNMYDAYGYSVAIHDDFAIVGAVGREMTVVDTNQGEVFIFKKNNDIWELHQNLLAPDRKNHDWFGSSVTINENFILIGAEQASDSQGKVYIYEKQATTWDFKQILNPTKTNIYRHFGKSVSIFNDYIAVGCRSNFDANEDNEMPSAGAVYIYKYNSETWEQSQKIVANDRYPSCFFGSSIDMYGNYLIVGAPNDPRNAQGEVNPSTTNTGSAYIFKLEDETWIQVKKILEPYIQYFNLHTQFGHAVSIYENTITIATHQHGWDPVGQNYAAYSGAFYMYRNIFDEWEYTQKIVASDRDTADNFAFSVSIYENNIIAGSLHQNFDENNENKLTSAGAAYIFQNFAEIAVTQDSLFVKNGDTYDFGEITVGNSSDTVNFHISNIGAATLYLTENPLIQFGENGDNDCFTLLQNNTANYVMPGDNTYFSLIFNPNLYGDISAQIIINSNDINNNPYIIDIVGIGRKHEQIITDFADLEVKTYGDSDFVISANASSNLDVVFTSSDPDIAICTGVNGSTISIVNAGECEIYANQAGNDEYFPAPQVAKTLIVNKKEIDVYAEDNSKIYGENDPELTYGYTPTLVGDDDFTGELVRITGENVGTYTINQGTLLLSDNYILNYNSADFEILKRPITVTVDAGQTKVYTSSDPTPFTYTYSGGLIGSDQFTGFLNREVGEDVGEYEILQNNLALSNNYEITFISSIFTITPKQITITANSGQNKTYGFDDPVYFAYTLSEFLHSGNSITGSLERIEGEDVGEYEITVGTLEISSNYTFVYQSANFEILPRNITVKANQNQSKFYGDQDPILTYTVIGNFVEGDSLTGSLSREEGEALGTYPIKLGSLSAGDNYSIEFISQNFEIKKKHILITVDPNQSKEYRDPDPILTFTYSPELATGDNFSGALSREQGEIIGFYDILQGNLSLSSNYELTIMPNAQFEITQRAISVTIDPNQSKIYGETDPVLSYSYTDNLAEGDSFSGFLYRAQGENVGEYQIFYDNLQINPNYNVTYLGTDNYFEILPREIIVTANAASKTYGHNDPYEFTYSIQGELAFNDYFTGELEREPGEDAGIYQILANNFSINNISNYTLIYNTANFTILPREIIIKATEGQSKAYGEDDPEFTYSVISGSVINNDEFYGELTRESGEDVGHYEILQGNLSLGENYNITYQSSQFEITPANITVIAHQGQSKVYGEEDPEFTYYVQGNILDNDEFSGQLTREQGEDIGHYEILQGDLNLGENYNINYQSAQFEITPIILTVIADQGLTKIYGEEDPEFTYTVQGNVEQVNFTGALSRLQGEDAGIYEINVGDLQVETNYEFTFVPANFEILKATPEIYWENPADIYDDEALSEIQLNASANIDGNFTYNPDFGTYLPVGNNQELHVLFTPNSQNYNQAEKTVYVNVILRDNVDENILSQLSMYPNPAKDYVNLYLNDAIADKYEVYDITGKLLTTDIINSESTEIFIDKLNPGVYLLKVYNNNQNIAILRIVKN
ncbi:MAG TPA: MBG domain-containing protein [Bacteroidales bacterium]|nr:MBG domain-containing protein [Bacteroidales bacterium]